MGGVKRPPPPSPNPPPEGGSTPARPHWSADGVALPLAAVAWLLPPRMWPHPRPVAGPAPVRLASPRRSVRKLTPSCRRNDVQCPPPPPHPPRPAPPPRACVCARCPTGLSPSCADVTVVAPFVFRRRREDCPASSLHVSRVPSFARATLGQGGARGSTDRRERRRLSKLPHRCVDRTHHGPGCDVRLLEKSRQN